MGLRAGSTVSDGIFGVETLTGDHAAPRLHVVSFCTSPTSIETFVATSTTVSTSATECQEPMLEMRSTRPSRLELGCPSWMTER